MPDIIRAVKRLRQQFDQLLRVEEGVAPGGTSSHALGRPRRSDLSWHSMAIATGVERQGKVVRCFNPHALHSLLYPSPSCRNTNTN
jgi:hypothetical protein